MACIPDCYDFPLFDISMVLSFLSAEISTKTFVTKRKTERTQKANQDNNPGRWAMMHATFFCTCAC